jgi:hypothetical protein
LGKIRETSEVEELQERSQRRVKSGNDLRGIERMKTCDYIYWKFRQWRIEAKMYFSLGVFLFGFGVIQAEPLIILGVCFSGLTLMGSSLWFASWIAKADSFI